MGCFFSCFPIRNDDHGGPHLVSTTSNRFKSTQEVLVSKNRLSALFLAEEKEDCESNVGKIKDYDSPQINKEIRDEAKFLKACGTLQETPVEIRKGSAKFKGSPPVYKDSTASSKFHSWLAESSIKEVSSDKKINESPTSVTLRDGLVKESVSSQHTPSSCIANVHNTGRISNDDGEARSSEASQTDNVTTSILPWPSAIDAHGRNKSIQFERDLENFSSKGPSSEPEDSCQISMEFDSPGEQNISKDYPKLTPLKITDEMQTPGTYFPTNSDILANNKTRIRSQWQAMKKGDVDDETLKLEAGEKSSVEESIVEGSLSSWFKPKSKYDGNDPNARNNFRFGKTPVDRPIIGMVAAHWNENEVSNISPKWWDGNGIPNSTNKYKEDQKVSWHATPFEERLEKALSEESLISQKKHINGTPIVFDEYDQRDTASSQLQASTHSQSVVSF